MTWESILTQARDSYRNTPNRNKTISKTNYSSLLDAFEQLVPHATINQALETDLRRNLPGSGMSGLTPITLNQRIKDAKKFANSNDLYPATGEGICENLRALVSVTPPSNLNNILNPIQNIFQSINNGNL